MVEVKPSSPRATSGSTGGRVSGAGERAGRLRLPSSMPILTAAASYARSSEAGSVLVTCAFAITSSRWRRLSNTSRLSVNMNTASGSF